MKAGGILVVIDGPSAVGKSTIFRALLGRDDVRFGVAKRCTTRQPRPREDDEDIYEFISHDEYGAMAGAGEFIEYKCYKFGMCYALPKKNVLPRLAAGEHLLAMINLGNIGMVRSVVPQTFGVFLSTSLETVRKRLEERGTHTPEQIEERLGNAADSRRFLPLYDLVVQNEDRPVAEVVQEIVEQFRAFERLTS